MLSPCLAITVASGLQNKMGRMKSPSGPFTLSRILSSYIFSANVFFRMSEVI